VSLFSVYFDEDAMNRNLVAALRQRGLRVLTPLELNFIGKTDEEQLLFATSHECVLYTFNVSDFNSLHRNWMKTGRHHGGLILAMQGSSVGEQLRRILRLRAVRTAEEMRDSVEFLSTWR
jgi:hypothetical protein